MTFLKKIKFTNKKIIILGGSGLIGSKIAKNILSIGGNVLILDIKKNKDLRHLSLIKQSRLSVMEIDYKSWKIINKIGSIRSK